MSTTNKQSASLLRRPLTKSRFKLAHQCPTKLYFHDRPKEYANEKQDDSFLRNLAHGGFQVGALAQVYFPGGHEISTLDSEEALSQTAALLTRDSVTIFEAAFQYQNLFIRADIVQKEDGTLRVYEAKAKSYARGEDEFWQKREAHLDGDWKKYLYDIAFQHFVIQSANPSLTVIPYLYLANKRAVATVDGMNQRFRLVSKNGRDRVFYDKALRPEEFGAELLVKVDVSREVEAIQSGKPNGSDAPDWPKEHSFSSWVRFLATEYQGDRKIPPKVTGECKKCEYRVKKEEYPERKSGFEECWNEALALKPGELEARVPIFEIGKLTTPPLLAKGIYFIDQLAEKDLIPKAKPKKAPPPGFTASERKILQWQRTIEKSKEAQFDEENFRSEIREYKYPLHFIDFETSTVAIPFNKGRRPYELIAFQYFSPPDARKRHDRARRTMDLHPSGQISQFRLRPGPEEGIGKRRRDGVPLRRIREYGALPDPITAR